MAVCEDNLVVCFVCSIPFSPGEAKNGMLCVGPTSGGNFIKTKKVRRNDEPFRSSSWT